MPKIKNIIIFIVIGAIFVSIYIFFIKKSSNDTPTMISSSGSSVVSSTVAGGVNKTTTQDFLSLLLNVKNIKLNDAIFSENAFTGLHDSSITLIPDGNEGRPNPFAPIGADVVTVPPPICTLPKILNTLTNICVDPLSN